MSAGKLMVQHPVPECGCDAGRVPAVPMRLHPPARSGETTSYAGSKRMRIVERRDTARGESVLVAAIRLDGVRRVDHIDRIIWCVACHSAGGVIRPPFCKNNRSLYPGGRTTSCLRLLHTVGSVQPGTGKNAGRFWRSTIPCESLTAARHRPRPGGSEKSSPVEVHSTQRALKRPGRQLATLRNFEMRMRDGPRSVLYP
jgi:hypothetical protein